MPADEPGYLRIATEEAFAPPELLAAWREMLDAGAVDDPGFRSLWGFYLNSDSERATSLRERLQDLGQRRLADMDATGIDRQIISLTAPGTQIFDAGRAVAMATLANDQLAEACQAHPDRYTGLTAIAPQDPEAAAAEIERGAKLGFKGVIINSHHLLRLIVAGVFDQFPRLRLVVGHLGEALPFWLFRLDYMHAATLRSRRYPQWRELAARPSDYMRRNVWVTTSGMAWAPAIMFTREVLGGDRVLYAMDYPYQFVADEVTVQDQLPLGPADKKAFFQSNAERVFRL